MEIPAKTAPKTFSDVIKFPAILKPDGEVIFDPRFKTMPYTALTEFASFLGGRIIETQWVAEFKFDRLSCNRKDCYMTPLENGLCSNHQRKG